MGPSNPDPRGRSPECRRDPRRGLGFPHLLGALALVSTLSCGEAPLGDPWAEVGTGELAFVPIADGDDAELHAGAQGGWHLWVSVRAYAFGEQARLGTRIEPLDWEGPVQEGSRPVPLERAEDGVRTFVGSPAVLSYASCFVGRPTRLTLTLSDESGRLATDERIVVPQAPPDPPMEDCTWEP